MVKRSEIISALYYQTIVLDVRTRRSKRVWKPKDLIDVDIIVYNIVFFLNNIDAMYPQKLIGRPGLIVLSRLKIHVSERSRWLCGTRFPMRISSAVCLFADELSNSRAYNEL